MLIGNEMRLRNDTTYEYRLQSENRKCENELRMSLKASIFSVFISSLRY